jgi:hypothetical protein
MHLEVVGPILSTYTTQAGAVMSETSRRDFMVAGAVLGIGVPSVTLAAVRGSVGSSVVETPASAIVETSAGKVRGFVRNGIFTFKGIP